jgi:hypothetical protein
VRWGMERGGGRTTQRKGEGEICLKWK